jgi:uncharacterized SAM-binding protein YcdF (DUF218 family)
MLFFNKFLPLFVLPIGWITLLLLFAIWRKKRWPAWVALAVLFIASLPAVAVRLLGWVEARYPAIALNQVEPADAVVVLGGILGPRSEPGFIPNFSDTSERFDAGVALLQAGKVGQLVFTGARMSWAGTPTTEGDELKRIAVTRGLPADKILVTREVLNTADEAAAVAEMMKARGWKRVVLVTTGWHMSRSAWQFRRAGVDAVFFPVDFRHDRTRRLTTIDFVPRAEAWGQTETALRECYGYLFYRIFR